MKKLAFLFILLIVIMAVITLSSALYIVNEPEQVIITQFGKPVGDPVLEPGIHFKTPFIQKANYFEKRFLEWDGDANQIPTKDKRFIWVDTYARWRIVDPLLFFQRVRDERGAQTRLDDILDGETRNVIANHNLVEIVRSSNRELQFGDIFQDQKTVSSLAMIKHGRDRITKIIIKAASPRLRELGIELLDLKFKRINYVKEVQRKIFDRMIAERQRIAERFRSEGRGEAAEIIGKKERELRKIRSEAYREAQKIMGKADAEATAIYASAYDQSPAARDFYRFLKTMETYRNTLSEKDWLVLTTEGDLFRFLRKHETVIKK